MPTMTAYFTAVGTVDDPDLSIGAGTFPTILMTNDGDTSYMLCNDNLCREQYTLTNLPAGAISVTAIHAYTAAKKVAAGTPAMTGGIYIDGGLIEGAGNAYTTGAYETNNWALAGGPWTAASFNAAEGSIFKNGPTANTSLNITMFYLSVTYTIAMGSPMFLFASVLPPILSLGTLCAREWTHIRSRISSQFSDDEWAEVVRASREYRHPAYCFMG